jgi:hypothetical protein
VYELVVGYFDLSLAQHAADIAGQTDGACGLDMSVKWQKRT